MSHVKNVEAYSRLVGFCTGLGGRYNPGQQNLQLIAMRALLEEAQSSLQDVSLKQDAYERKRNERGNAFTGLDLLASRVINIMGAAQLSAADIEDARFYYRLLAGARATPVEPATAVDSDTEATTRRFGQLSYVAKASNFFKLAQKAQQLPGYTTNEPDLTADALLEKAGTLHRLNKEVHDAKVDLIMARQQRNQLIYRSKHGIVDNARAAKRYVKATFGTRSAQASSLKDVSFTKLKIK